MSVVEFQLEISSSRQGWWYSLVLFISAYWYFMRIIVDLNKKKGLSKEELFKRLVLYFICVMNWSLSNCPALALIYQLIIQKYSVNFRLHVYSSKGKFLSILLSWLNLVFIILWWTIPKNFDHFLSPKTGSLKCQHKMWN